MADLAKISDCRVLVACASSLLLLAACATTNPFFDRSKTHHTPTGFRNPHTDTAVKGLWALWQWKLESARAGLPPLPQTPTPVREPDLAFLTENARAGEKMVPTITWIGHATALAQFSGLNILVDPVFSERASPLRFYGPRRAQAPGIALTQLPRIDLVLISHNHYDHLDQASVLALQGQTGGPPLFVVPLGIQRWLAEVGITRVIELDWWDAHRLPGARGEVEIVLTPAQHWSGRGLTDRLATLWGGFAVFAPDFHLFYSGDTGYSPDFAEIQGRFAPRQTRGGFDLALLPIGAYEPRWFMREQHVNPEEAVQIHLDLAAKRSMGIHWGTFNLTDEALDEAPQALDRARAARGIARDDFFVLAIGETRRLPRRD